MPRLGINTTEAKSFEPLPDDRYECEIVEVSEVKTAGSGSQYVVVTFSVTDGEYTDRKLFRNYMIEGPGVGFLMDLWRKATKEELEVGLEELEIDTDDLVGSRVVCITEQEEYEGTTRSTVAKVLAA